jgi:chitodextrinase
METKLEELIDEIQQQELITLNPTKPFNQPDLIAVSSVNRINDDSTQNGYSSFTVNLPLPAINVKSLQLLQTNIPQANPSIPNTACVFWYYRLSQYSGLTPSLDNLYYVRLLPTNYKQEYIEDPTIYGYNQTFNSYSALATQLAKSCNQDLLNMNVNQLNIIQNENAYVPFIPSDISITYDSGSNKFQMRGTNTQVAYLEYDADTLYDVGDVITNAQRNTAYVNLLGSKGLSPTDNTFVEWFASNSFVIGNIVRFNDIVYKVIAAGQNVSLNPAVQTPTYYTRLGRLLPVSSYTAWVSGTNYAVGDPVSYNGVVYVLFADGESTTINPSLQPSKWVSQPTQITAPSSVWGIDNIEIVGEWFAGMFYPVGTIVYYDGELYSSTSIEPNAFSQPPTNDDYWDLFEAPPYWYRYLIAGYEDPLVRKMQGELFNVEWNSGRTYNVGAVVEYTGVPFTALKTNRGDEPVASVDAWDSGTAYITNDVVSYQEYIYIARANSTNQTPVLNSAFWIRQTPVSSNPALNEWSSTTTYALYDVVSYQGLMYQSTFSGANTGFIPSNNVRWALRNYVEWNAGTNYNVIPRIVLYGGNLFRNNLINNRANTPAYNSSVWNFLGSPATEWNDALVYNIGDLAIYGARYFQSLVNNNLNLIPSAQPESWELIGVVDSWELATAPLRTGLYGLTAEYDMTDFRYDSNEVYLNFPYGVGGQPYNPAPKRLLNSILGFTWNGIFNPSQLTDIGVYDEAQLTTQQQPLLYNRLRPVPGYSSSLIIPEELGSDEGTASVALVYTADSYANLVYSSIISIYADIVKASSVDTQGATKLLALTSMNCGNLGIAFWSNYLENPLLKVQGDIYSVFIEFRDEFGEPFVLPNSAVATLTFKLNY